MKKRVYTSIAIVIVLALLFVLKVYVSDYFFDAFFVIVACFAGYEMSRILTKTGRFNHHILATVFPAFLLAINLTGIHLIEARGDLFWLLYTILLDLALVVAAVLLAFLVQIFRRKRVMNEITVRGLKNVSVAKFSFKKAFNTSIAFVYPSLLFLIFNFVNHIEAMPLEKLEGVSSYVSVFVLLTAFLIPMITDTFAMLTGSLIGGKKLCPKLSPGKTIAGTVGGVLWCVLVSACVYLVFGCIESFGAFMQVLPIWAYLLIVFFGSCVAQGGDLFESLLKRRANVKDSGKVLPGHGGMLDRIDSYVFIAPYILLAFWILAI